MQRNKSRTLSFFLSNFFFFWFNSREICRHRVSSFKFENSFVYATTLTSLFSIAIDETIKLVEGVGGNAYGYKCDLADKEDVYRIAKKTRDEVGDVSSTTK